VWSKSKNVLNVKLFNLSAYLCTYKFMHDYWIDQVQLGCSLNFSCIKPSNYKDIIYGMNNKINYNQWVYIKYYIVKLYYYIDSEIDFFIKTHLSLKVKNRTIYINERSKPLNSMWSWREKKIVRYFNTLYLIINMFNRGQL